MKPGVVKGRMTYSVPLVEVWISPRLCAHRVVFLRRFPVKHLDDRWRFRKPRPPDSPWSGSRWVDFLPVGAVVRLYAATDRWGYTAAGRLAISRGWLEDDRHDDAT